MLQDCACILERRQAHTGLTKLGLAAEKGYVQGARQASWVTGGAGLAADVRDESSIVRAGSGTGLLGLGLGFGGSLANASLPFGVMILDLRRVRRGRVWVGPAL